MNLNIIITYTRNFKVICFSIFNMHFTPIILYYFSPILHKSIIYRRIHGTILPCLNIFIRHQRFSIR